LNLNAKLINHANHFFRSQ